MLSRSPSALPFQVLSVLLSPACRLCIDELPLSCFLGAHQHCQQADCLVCREQLNAVLLSLEDELSVLDLRYADLLRQAQEHCSSEAEDAEVTALLSPCMAS